MPVTGPLQSLGTRIAFIPLHRIGKDARLSPKKATVIAECSPRTNYADCQSNSLPAPDVCVIRSAASQCQLSANVRCEVLLTPTEEPLPKIVGERTETHVRIKTPEKCSAAKPKKTASPVAATDMCTVALSRIAIPENSAVKVSEISASKDTLLSAHTVVVGDVASASPASPRPVSENLTSNTATCDGQNRDDSRLASLRPASIVYPSCEQNVFLGNFGLASRADPVSYTHLTLPTILRV